MVSSPKPPLLPISFTAFEPFLTDSLSPPPLSLLLFRLVKSPPKDKGKGAALRRNVPHLPPLPKHPAASSSSSSSGGGGGGGGGGKSRGKSNPVSQGQDRGRGGRAKAPESPTIARRMSSLPKPIAQKPESLTSSPTGRSLADAGTQTEGPVATTAPATMAPATEEGRLCGALLLEMVDTARELGEIYRKERKRTKARRQRNQLCCAIC